jgi:hypothetical protein
MFATGALADELSSKLPSSFSAAKPCFTTHGAPPLFIPAMVMPGFEPRTDAKDSKYTG